MRADWPLDPEISYLNHGTVGVPSAGIALVLGLDRILDMIRTAANITGDATVSVVIASGEGVLGEPDLSEDADRIRMRKNA